MGVAIPKVLAGKIEIIQSPTIKTIGNKIYSKKLTISYFSSVSQDIYDSLLFRWKKIPPSVLKDFPKYNFPRVS